MAHLVEFDLREGGSIIVEVDDAISRPVRVSKPGEIADKAKKSFDEAVAGIRPIAQAVVSQLVELAPETISVELGVKFSAEAGVVLAKAASEGTCKLTLTWRPKPVA